MFNLKKLSLLLATGFIQYSVGINFTNSSPRPVVFTFLSEDERELARFVLDPNEQMILPRAETPSISDARTLQAVARSTMPDEDVELFSMTLPTNDTTSIAIPASGEEPPIELQTVSPILRMRILRH